MTIQEAVDKLEKLDYKMIDGTSWVRFKDVGKVITKGIEL